MSLVDGLSDSRSSRNPNAAMAPPQTMSCQMSEWGAAVVTERLLASVAAAMATPPNSAVGLLCHRSSLGRATNPLRCASARQTGVSASETTHAMPNWTMSAIPETGGLYNADLDLALAEIPS